MTCAQLVVSVKGFSLFSVSKREEKELEYKKNVYSLAREHEKVSLLLDIACYVWIVFVFKLTPSLLPMVLFYDCRQERREEGLEMRPCCHMSNHFCLPRQPSWRRYIVTTYQQEIQ